MSVIVASLRDVEFEGKTKTSLRNAFCDTAEELLSEMLHLAEKNCQDAVLMDADGKEMFAFRHGALAKAKEIADELRKVKE